MPDEEFVAFVRSIPVERRRVEGVDGFKRWFIKEANGTEYILRPESSRKNL